MEFELEGTTASEWVAVEGVATVALLCLRIQRIFAVVELLPHFCKIIEKVLRFSAIQAS